MIDLHSHVLPGLDDGARTVEDSLALARAAAEAGTTVLAATPHIREDHPFDPARIRPAVAELNASLTEAGIPVEVAPGAEVAITKLVEIGEAALASLCLGEGPYLLVESPYTHAGDLLERALFEAQVAGLRPVLAHPERSPCFLGDLDRLSDLVARGVLCSVTAGSMTGQFGGTVRELTARLFEHGLVHDVASDSHGASYRPPDLRPGFESLEAELPGLLGQADWFARAVPEAMLAGEELPERPVPLERPPRGAGAKLAASTRRALSLRRRG